MKTLILISLLFVSSLSYGQTKPDTTKLYFICSPHHIQVMNKEQYDDFIRSLNFQKAMQYKKEHKYETLKVIGIYAGSIILESLGDGLNDNGNKTWGHLSKVFSTGLLLSSPFIIKYDKSKWYIYLLSYTSLRIGLFDMTYCTTRHLPLNYIGSTSITDKAWTKIGGQPSFIRGLSFTFGIFLTIKEL
jgi:hypothetical protein